MGVWDRFETIVTPEEVTEAKSQFAPLEAGDYEAVLESIEPSESKEGLPMLKGKFRTLENRVIFYNQMLQNLNYPNMTAVNVAEAVTFVSALLGEDVAFKGLSDFAGIVETIPVGESYKVNVSYGKKDLDMKFPKLKIVEKIGFTPVGADEDIPF